MRLCLFVLLSALSVTPALAEGEAQFTASEDGCIREEVSAQEEAMVFSEAYDSTRETVGAYDM
jgi:hypothetical protein